MHKKPEISLIICTHNRAATLKSSLEFYKRITSQIPYEILVIANACTDNTIEVVKQAMEELPLLSYAIESKVGHSNARNAGLQHAKAPFVFYIDDDAYPDPDIISQLYRLITTNDIKCISGITKYWDANSPSWIKASFVEVPLFRQDFGVMPYSGYINGCACGFSKSVLLELGGFDPSLGMKAKSIGYYDEVAAQRMIAAAGHTIYYAPTLVVHHQSHSKTVWQFLKSSYYKGKYRRQTKKTNPIKSFILFVLNVAKGILKWPIYRLNHSTQVSTLYSFQKASNYLGQSI